MPIPAGRPDRAEFAAEPGLTPAERAVLRRLRRGESALRTARRLRGIRQRAALRRRRRVLDRLAERDVHSLVRIVMELGL